MASASDIRAGRAYVEVYVKNSAFLRGLKNIQKDLNTLGSGISTMGRRTLALGAGMATPLLGAAKLFASVGDSFHKMSLRTGMSAEALSGLGFAAQQSGTDMASVELSVRRMQRAITDAAGGSKEVQSAFSALGLSVDQIAKLSPEEQFLSIAEALSQVADPTQRAALAMEVFGKGGTAMLPMVAKGRAGIAELMAEAKSLGLIMSSDTAKSAAELNDAFGCLWSAGKAIALAFGGAVAPMLTGLATSLAKGARIVIDWINAHKQMVTTVLLVGGALAGLGVAILGVGSAISFVGSVFGTVAAAAKMFGVAIGLALGLVTSPLVLVTAALAGIAYYLATTPAAAAKLGTTFSGALQNVKTVATDLWSDMRQGFANIVEDGGSAFRSIATSIQAGDIEGAISVALAFVKLEWSRLVNWVTGKWETFRNFWGDVTSGLAIAVIDAVATIKTAWAEAVAFMQKQWKSFKVSTFTEKVANAIAPLFAKIEGVSVEDARRTLAEDMARGREDLPSKNAEIDAKTAEYKAEVERNRESQTSDVARQDVVAQEERARGTDEAARKLADAKEAFEEAKEEAAGEAMRRAAQAKNRALLIDTPQGDAKASATAPSTTQITSTGTFSGYAAAAMAGGGNAAERTASATIRMVGQFSRLIGINVESLAELRLLAKQMGYLP